MALGKGLASLIPNREGNSAEEAVEKIDSMEVVEETVKAKASPAAPKKMINVVEDFDELEEMEEMTPPAKPLVTPISIDPDDIPREQAVSKTTSILVQKEEEVTAAAPELADPLPPAQSYKRKADVKAAKRPAPADQEEEHGDVWDKHEEKIIHIPIGDIDINPMQPRRAFDDAEMDDLKNSIDQHGILQPLVVRRLSTNKFELIAGERRLRAAKSLRWTKVPCVIRRDVKSDQSRLVYALIENIQRENLNPVEEALAYQQLNQEYGLTHEEIGQRVGRSRVGITNIVRILQLPAEVQRGLIDGKITIGHAKAILMIPDQEKQVRFFRHLLDEGLTVRKAETRARRIQRTMQVDDTHRSKRQRNAHPLATKLTPALEERYGYDARVKFIDNKNWFEVVFKAHNETEIRELVGRLMGTVDLPSADQDSDVIDS